VEDALDLTDQFGQIMLAQLLDDVAVFANSELIDESDQMLAA
jgi:hypothetical protein